RAGARSRRAQARAQASLRAEHGRARRRARLGTGQPSLENLMADIDARVAIEQTYKLYIKGEFVRSESGRSYHAKDETTGGGTNRWRGSRKDARDGVLSSKAGTASWAGKTAYLRGQVLYRLAEVMEGRRRELEDARGAAGAKDVEREVLASIDRV